VNKYSIPEFKGLPNTFISPAFAQYSEFLICESPIPVDCNRNGDLDFSCVGGGRVEGSFIIPGVSCSQSPPCTVTVNGQPAENFCGGPQQFGLGPGIDCGGGCLYEPSCDIVNGSCSGGELVEVQCSGFTGCEILMT